MDPFIIHKLQRPKEGEIVCVHGISIKDLREFASEGMRYSTDEIPQEVCALYDAIAQPQLKDRKFACLTAYIAITFQGRKIQRDHSEGSNVELILSMSMIVDRLFVFNGDVANLARDLRQNRITKANLRVCLGTDQALVACLATLSKNNLSPRAEPRLRGNAFEARLFDGIKPEDLSQICIENPGDQEALDLADKLRSWRGR